MSETLTLQITNAYWFCTGSMAIDCNWINHQLKSRVYTWFKACSLQLYLISTNYHNKYLYQIYEFISVITTKEKLETSNWKQWTDIIWSNNE